MRPEVTRQILPASERGVRAGAGAGAAVEAAPVPSAAPPAWDGLGRGGGGGSGSGGGGGVGAAGVPSRTSAAASVTATAAAATAAAASPSPATTGGGADASSVPPDPPSAPPPLPPWIKPIAAATRRHSLARATALDPPRVRTSRMSKARLTGCGECEGGVCVCVGGEVRKDGWTKRRENTFESRPGIEMAEDRMAEDREQRRPRHGPWSLPAHRQRGVQGPAAPSSGSRPPAPEPPSTLGGMRLGRRSETRRGLERVARGGLPLS